MGFSLHGIISGVRHFAGDAVDQGEDFAQAVKNKLSGTGSAVKQTAGQWFDKGLDKGLPAAGTVLQKGYDLLPTGVVNAALSGVETGVDAGAFLVEHIPGMPAGAKKLAGDLAQVNLNGITDNTFGDGQKLEADWGNLTFDWFFERRPTSLGRWDTVTEKDEKTGKVEKFDRVTVTDLAYARDLSKLDNQNLAARLLLQGGAQPGKVVTVQWQYTGEGTKEGGIEFGLGDADGNTFITNPNEPGGGHYVTHGGHYGVLESFMGSYTTTAKVVGVDPATGNVTIEYTVKNDSVWQSGTRVNASGQRAGLPPYLIPNQESGTGTHLGGNFQQVYTWRQTFAPSSDPRQNPTPVSPVSLPPSLSGAQVVENGATGKPETGAGPTGQPTTTPKSDAKVAPHGGATGRIDTALERQGYKAIVVKPGDTIWDLAKSNHVSFEETLKLNKAHIADPDLIYPGDVVYLPVKDTPKGGTRNRAM